MSTLFMLSSASMQLRHQAQTLTNKQWFHLLQNHKQTIIDKLFPLIGKYDTNLAHDVNELYVGNKSLYNLIESSRNVMINIESSRNVMINIASYLQPSEQETFKMISTRCFAHYQQYKRKRIFDEYIENQKKCQKILNGRMPIIARPLISYDSAKDKVEKDTESALNDKLLSLSLGVKRAICHKIISMDSENGTDQTKSSLISFYCPSLQSLCDLPDDAIFNILMYIDMNREIFKLIRINKAFKSLITSYPQSPVFKLYPLSLKGPKKYKKPTRKTTKKRKNKKMDKESDEKQETSNIASLVIYTFNDKQRWFEPKTIEINDGNRHKMDTLNEWKGYQYIRSIQLFGEKEYGLQYGSDFDKIVYDKSIRDIFEDMDYSNHLTMKSPPIPSRILLAFDNLFKYIQCIDIDYRATSFFYGEPNEWLNSNNMPKLVSLKLYCSRIKIYNKDENTINASNWSIDSINNVIHSFQHQLQALYLIFNAAESVQNIDNDIILDLSGCQCLKSAEIFDVSYSNKFNVNVSDLRIGLISIYGVFGPENIIGRNDMICIAFNILAYNDDDDDRSMMQVDGKDNNDQKWIHYLNSQQLDANNVHSPFIMTRKRGRSAHCILVHDKYECAAKLWALRDVIDTNVLEEYEGLNWALNWN